MRGKELLEKMAYVRAGLILESERKPKRRLSLVGLCSAACLLLAVGTVGALSLTGVINPNFSVNEQNLPIIEPMEQVGGMGFEGYRVHDLSEIITDSYFEGKKTPKTLPVFKNHYYESNIDEMKGEILDLAEKLGLDTATLEITDDAPSEDAIEQMKAAFGGGEVPPEFKLPSVVQAEQSDIRINYFIGGSLEVFFDEPVPLPEEYRCPIDESDKDKRIATGEYLAEHYAYLTRMKNPKVRLSPEGYITAYDDSGTKEEKMLNFTFRYVNFHTNENGDLRIIRFHKSDLSDRIGDYPIISEERALELLDEGRYISTVQEVPTSSDVEKTVLVYRTGGKSKYYLPYYKFFVDITETMGAEDDKRCYTAYYVPAVDPAYLGEMSVWNGSFNSGE